MISFKNTTTQYGLGGRILHWTSVSLLIALIVTANQFEGLAEGLDKKDLVNLHVSLGLIFLMIMFSRLYWRLTNVNPVHSYQIPSWQKFSAIFLHRTIYAIVIFQSICGISSLIFSGKGIAFFSIFTIPTFLTEQKLYLELSNTLHYVISIVIYPLFAIHISAAIYHQLFGVVDDE